MPATLQANLVSEVNLYRAKNSRQGIFSSDWKVYRATQPELLDRVWEIPLEVGKNASEKLLDPTTAQFLSLDPAVGRTHSPYAYVAGNPLNGTDPSGLCGLWGNDTCWGDALGWIGHHPAQAVEVGVGVVGVAVAGALTGGAAWGIGAAAAAEGGETGLVAAGLAADLRFISGPLIVSKIVGAAAGGFYMIANGLGLMQSTPNSVNSSNYTPQSGRCLA